MLTLHWGLQKYPRRRQMEKNPICYFASKYSGTFCIAKPQLPSWPWPALQTRAFPRGTPAAFVLWRVTDCTFAAGHDTAANPGIFQPQPVPRLWVLVGVLGWRGRGAGDQGVFPEHVVGYLAGGPERCFRSPVKPPGDIIQAGETLKAVSHCSVHYLLAFGTQATLSGRATGTQGGGRVEVPIPASNRIRNSPPSTRGGEVVVAEPRLHVMLLCVVLQEG